MKALRELVARIPEHPGLVPVLDAGVADGRVFIVTPPVTAEPLDAALAEYGPAAIADALPRLRQLAEALDCAASHDLAHGRLTPADLLVSSDDTCIVGVGVAARLARAGVTRAATAPYAAPEVLRGEPGDAPADQYALAVIAFEWITGLPFSRDAIAGLRVPGAGREGLIRALTIASADDPAARFASCAAFVGAIEDAVRSEHDDAVAPPHVAVVAELPLHGDISRAPAFRVADPAVADRRANPALFAAILAAGLAAGAAVMWMVGGRPSSDVIAAPETRNAGHDASPNPDSIDPPSSAAPARSPEGARPPDASPREVTEAAIAPARDDVDERTSTTGAVLPREPARPPQLEAALLVHTNPEGAVVIIDGVARGTTPVAVRGLALGTRTVSVSRPGYRPAERQVMLTIDRPSRTMEIDLTALRAVPAAPARATTATVIVDSRPAGASVLVDGRAAGVTPVTLTLPPGAHTIRMERDGYRAVTTRVELKAGERSRVAARLEGGQDDE